MAACPACGKELPGEFPFCPHCGAPLTGETREQRKTVTVLFCDLTGSTELGESTDPEALRALLARYFERMKAIVELHGGTVEKFIGDAVMAVFGIPQAHEDDALRACRAAVEMRDALPELGIRGRIGVNTGEVVTGTSERLATGDAVNVAARFEQAAEPGEVLIGESTYALVREAVVTEPAGPLGLKGKSEPMPAFRLVRVGDAPERPHGDVFVGRERELDEIAAAWVRAGAEQRCELVTVVAEAGVGKSRLAVEALDRLEARVVRGRCLSYGEGITYWPVVEVVKQLGARPSDPAAEAAIASLLGERDAGTSAEEIAWAFRRLLEEQAPLICVFEDIHWGEETFLDLVEHVTLLSAGSQVLLLCTARPELIERRHSWPVTVRLAPLNQLDVDRLMPGSLSGELREKIAHAAGGNPLFVSEMVAMAEAAHGEISVPPTLQALLTARLDQVDAAERRVLERGAVEGELFHRGAVQALAPDEPQVTARLAGLVRRELVRPDKAQISGEDGFRFRHLLIRDAAYDTLPKATRSELHERFALWLEQRGREMVELDEIVGYHLERAVRYREELGQQDEAARSLAVEAAGRLERAGRRARNRYDVGAVVNLLGRAAALLPDGSEARARILPQLGEAYLQAGELGRGERTLREAVELAEELSNETLLATAQIELLQALLLTAPEGVGERARSEADRLRPLIESLGDEALSARLWRLVGTLESMACRYADMEEAQERAIEHARRAGDAWQEADALVWLAPALHYGPKPARAALRRLSQVLEASRGHPSAEAGALIHMACLHAMLGEFTLGRTELERAATIYDEFGLPLQRCFVSMTSGELELIAGDFRAAEHALRPGYDAFERLGEKGLLSTQSAMLAHALCEQGRDEEAETFIEASRTAGASDDVATQVGWRTAKASILARQGEHVVAEQLARQAVELTEQTDNLNQRGDALKHLARVLTHSGRIPEAVDAIELGLTYYERKENHATIAQVLPQLQALQQRLIARQD